MKSSGGTSEYEDESEIDQSSSFEGIYTDDSSEEEVGLYALETIPRLELCRIKGFAGMIANRLRAC